MQRAPQWRQLWREACVSSLTPPPTHFQFCAEASKVSPNANAPLEPQQALGDRGGAGVGGRRHVVPNLEQALRVLASALARRSVPRHGNSQRHGNQGQEIGQERAPWRTHRLGKRLAWWLHMSPVGRCCRLRHA